MKRLGIMLCAYCAVFAIVVPAFVRPTARLIWNASGSVPIGLYTARRSTSAKLDDLVAANPPAPVARMMAKRGYLPLGVPMLKHVAALPGQRICRTGAQVSIDGKVVAEARSRDRHGRSLPRWAGCHVLNAAEVLLLNPASPDSFDGRYFGVVPTASIVAVLTPVWTSSGGDAVGNSAANPTTNGVSRWS